jgi:hypothetical protein
MEGYWVRTSVKVELTKEEKRLIGRHSSPRWEIDIVAYKGGKNLLRIVECKSYFDSVGVRASAFDGSNPEHAQRYKLFNDAELRRVVFNRLCLQLAASSACGQSPALRLSLAAASRAGLSVVVESSTRTEEQPQQTHRTADRQGSAFAREPRAGRDLRTRRRSLVDCCSEGSE